MMRPASLTRRLLLSSLIIVPAFLGLSTIAMNRAYMESLNESEWQGLTAQLYALIAVAEPSQSTLVIETAMPSPQLETPDSGLYAQIITREGQAIWASNSLRTSAIQFPELAWSSSTGTAEEAMVSVGETWYRVLYFTTIWDLNGTDTIYRFELYQAQDDKEAALKAYQRTIALWLGGMILVLAAAQLFIARWGLRPLRDLSSEIDRIESGETDTINGDYPLELKPVTVSLNKLLKSEQQQRSRYRNSLADLAHSLKTPLSVVRAELNKENDRDNRQTLSDQISQMDLMISRQLKRANAEVKSVFLSPLLLEPSVSRLFSALSKVYQDKNLNFETDIPADFSLEVEEGDLLEVLGNLIENACKYGNQKVRVSANYHDEDCFINIHDDGPGINPHLLGKVLARGARADTTNKGQGIGLTIAVDILSSYNAELTLERSELGGAKFQIRFPRGEDSNNN